jgi:hypothetical protein
MKCFALLSFLKCIYRKAIDGKDELERNNKGRNSGTHLTERKANKWTQ